MATTTTTRHDPEWKRFPQTSAWVARWVERFLEILPPLARLQQQLAETTGTLLQDWLDYLSLHAGDTSHAELVELGYQAAESTPGEAVFRHDAGLFPAVRLTDDQPRTIALHVDSVQDFLFAHQRDHRTEIAGVAGGPLREACVAVDSGFAFNVIERTGTNGFECVAFSPDQVADVAVTREQLERRRRSFADDPAGFDALEALLRECIERVGRDLTCDLFFAAERRYWQSRNQAARVQKSRQDRLGMGWANHDHHTYRSSRTTFVRLIRILELLGMRCRERFYAGREAGWGAQVLDHPVCRPVVFADVDLQPDEVLADFAHEPLQERQDLGTVGLWCGLHGEAIFQAGMHHLECQFDFDLVRRQLADHGIESMDPFTDFEFLRQSFTRGERWPVADERIERLLAAERISAEQAARFRESGAIGSHLETLQRGDGYKGFNQTGISEIILRTDPRKQ